VDQSNKVAVGIGAAAGAIFTRIPYMEDGNLLTTTVCIITFASLTLLVWVGIKTVFKV
jgi:hypothetical protein